MSELSAGTVTVLHRRRARSAQVSLAANICALAAKTLRWSGTHPPARAQISASE
jgi:hypothetical protein